MSNFRLIFSVHRRDMDDIIICERCFDDNEVYYGEAYPYDNPCERCGYINKPKLTINPDKLLEYGIK